MYKVNVNTDTPINFFLKNNCLYYISKNNVSHKLSNYVSSYCYILDDYSNIHICYIDFKNRLNYYLYQNNSWNKKTLCKVFINKKNIQNIKFYALNNALHVFLIESNGSSYYKITNIYYDLDTHKHKYTSFNKECYTNFSLYILDSSNRYIVLSLRYNIQNTSSEDKFIFDTKSKSWDKYLNLDFNNQLIKYCKSIKYININ